MSDRTESPLIYRATCLVTGMAYIGLTKRGVMPRWKRHLYDTKKGNRTCPALSSAIKEHGIGAFVVEHLATALSPDDVPELERLLIAQHQTLWPNGYNLTAGGEGGIGRGWSEEQRAEASRRWVAFYTDPAQRARSSALHRGRVASPETRAKMAAAKLGTKRSPEACRKTSESLKAHLAEHPRSVETMEKIAAAHRGVPISPEARAKISAALKGRKFSDEIRANMRAGQRRRVAETQKQGA